MTKLELDIPGKFSRTALILDEQLSYNDWRFIGLQLADLKEWTNFAIGDWLEYGNIHFGEQYAQAASDLGISVDRLMILKHVASRVPQTLRNKALSWSHHKEVAKLDERQQKIWLDLADKNRWDIGELIQELTAAGLRRHLLHDKQDPSLPPRTVKRLFFMPSGVTAAFDENEKQMPDLQDSWLVRYILWLADQGAVVDEQTEIILPDGLKAKLFRIPDGWNWEILRS